MDLVLDLSNCEIEYQEGDGFFDSLTTFPSLNQLYINLSHNQLKRKGVNFLLSKLNIFT